MKTLTPGTDLRELMLDVARGKVVRLEPGAEPLSLFVLLNRDDVHLSKDGLIGGIGILLLSEATDAQMEKAYVNAMRTGVSGYVMSIAGQVCSDEVEILEIGSDLADLTIDQRFALRQLNPLDQKSWGSSLLKFFQAADGDALEDVAALINETRWTSNVWIERDRAQLALTDELTGKEVFQLWDDDFSQAIEDGFLSKPRHPRPSDSDWHQPALDYAESQGLMADLELKPKASAHSMPFSAPEVQSFERPRG